ncbi:hypothetical protein FHS85_002894 [Rhodoligotrophos appendicifer]|uniref:hypothetical protein n=1 Tax=Rhodoligotrophos appendicifer TaxID=987056 RepID=UPI0011860745|nr:hypothetical protein [Rhodoligotrophos appendicifer]
MNIIPGLSAVESLKNFDGLTTSDDWRRAEAYDRAHPRPSQRAAVRIGRVTMSKHVAVDLLAHAIADAIIRRGAVTERDLEQIGMSVAAAKPHMDEAFTRAKQIEPCLPGLLRDAL